MSSKKTEKVNRTEIINDSTSIDTMLRPMDFNNYIGQAKVIENLKTIILAARKRNEQMEHLLFFGQAGLGKTTLASIVARNMNSNLKITSGPVLEKTGDLATILSTLDPGDVLFIDEIHRINRSIEEMLYPAMESRQLHLVIGKGPAARMMTIDLPPFTLISATTRAGLISAPLRSRFGGVFKLDYYSIEDMEKIIKRSANILNIEIPDNAITKIAKASRFTPRTANRLLKRVRDVAQVDNKSNISSEGVDKALEMLEIDILGLEKHDRKLISTIIDKFDGGPVGISTLAATLGEDKGTIEDVYEPYLLKIDFIQRTPRGRMVTKKAYSHLNLSYNKYNK